MNSLFFVGLSVVNKVYFKGFYCWVSRFVWSGESIIDGCDIRPEQKMVANIICFKMRPYSYTCAGCAGSMVK